MTIVPGRVVNGRVEVEDVELPEGAEVSVYLHGDDGDQLTPEQLAELDEAIAEADRGEGVSADLVLQELRTMRDAEVGRRR
jgi:hypothetical protein